MTPDEKYAAKKEANRKYIAECRAWMKAHGICTHCLRERTEPNRSVCWKCLEKMREYSRKKRENMTEEERQIERQIKNAKTRERRIRKIESGICVLCKRPIYAGNKAYCYEHYIRVRRYGRERYEREKIARSTTARIYTPPKSRAMPLDHPWRKYNSQLFRTNKPE